MTALSGWVDDLIAIIVKLCFKHVDLLDAKDGIAAAPVLNDRTRRVWPIFVDKFLLFLLQEFLLQADLRLMV